MIGTVRGPYGRVIPLSTVITMVGAGWRGLVLQLVEDLFALGWDGSLHQIKEKWGGLRFYVGDATEEMHNRIHEAEKQSYTICERCGTSEAVSVGAVRGWVLTLCDTCREARTDG